MRETKTRLNLYSFYDRTGIESYLERQAEKGWLLEEATEFGWRFRKTESRKVHFAVTYFPKASAFDPEPGEGQAVFWDFCEHSGWKLVASNVQMQVFCSERENPVPIETDAMMEIEQIHAAAKKAFLLANSLLILAGLLLASPFARLAESYPLGLLTSNVVLFGSLSVLLMIALCAADTGRYYLWRRKALAAAELDGSFVETKSVRGLSLVVFCLLPISTAFALMCRSGNDQVALILVVVALAVGVAAVVARVSGFMRGRKASARKNLMATCVATFVAAIFISKALVFLAFDDASPLQTLKQEPVETYDFHGNEVGIYRSEIPLTIEELIETGYDDYSYNVLEESSSVLADRIWISQTPRMGDYDQPYLEYKVFKVKAPLLDGLLNDLALDAFTRYYISMPPGDRPQPEAVEVDATPWGANEAYQIRYNGEARLDFLLRYDRCIVEISFPHDWTLTDEQMATVGEKLG